MTSWSSNLFEFEWKREGGGVGAYPRLGTYLNKYSS